MLYYDRIDLTEGNDPAKTKEKNVWFVINCFLNQGFEF